MRVANQNSAYNEIKIRLSLGKLATIQFRILYLILPCPILKMEVLKYTELSLHVLLCECETASHPEGRTWTEGV
jgi:hypothetical protein